MEHLSHSLLISVPIVTATLIFLYSGNISLKKIAIILFSLSFLFSHSGSHHILTHFDTSKSDISHFCCIPLPADMPISEVVLFIFIVYFTNSLLQEKYQFILITPHWGRAPPQI